MNKDLQKKLYKILVLTDLLVQEFDTPSSTPTKLGKELINDANEYKENLLSVLDKFYNNNSLVCSDIVQTLSNKFEYNINRVIK